MYNVLGCTHVRHQDKAHGSTRNFDKFVTSQKNSLLTKGVCYYFNEEQRNAIIEKANISVTTESIDGVDYIMALN